MKQIIKIDVPAGKKAVYDEATQTIKFVDIEPVRSKSWEEFCKNHPNAGNEWYIDSDGDVKKVNDYRRFHKNNFATREDAEGILALIQLTRLHDEWVGNWKPTTDWYSICVYDKEIEVQRWISSQFLLSFPTEKMAKEFLDCFKDLIIKAKRFI